MLKTDLTGGRGWLDAAAAASVARIDRALGRPLDINEAGRTWAQQMVFWETYQRDGYPIALHPDTPSIHQLGNAIDTDDSDRRDLLNEHGWFQTVYRNGILVEPWHFEYDSSRDQHINDPEPAEPAETPEDNMLILVATSNSKDGLILKGRTYCDPLGSPVVIISADEAGAVEYWKKNGLPYRRAEWPGDTIRATVNVKGMHPHDVNTGRTDYTKVVY